MRTHCALLPFLCCCAASSHLRKESSGKDAEMDDVLKVAQQAHEAGDIYAKEKLSLSEGRSRKDIHLVVLLWRPCDNIDNMGCHFLHAAAGECTNTWKLGSGCRF